MKQNEELAGVLNSGHTRRTAPVIRVAEVNGEDLPVAFSTWCPMAIAGIGSQRDTLMSRSIIISLRRNLPDETVTRLPFDLHGQLLRMFVHQVLHRFNVADTQHTFRLLIRRFEVGRSGNQLVEFSSTWASGNR